MNPTGLDRSPPPLAPALHRVGETLARAGFDSWLVGEAVHRHLRGERAAAPLVASNAPFERILAVFPHAIPTRPGRALATCPSATGPIDLVALAPGGDLRDALGHCDFSVRAMALPLRSDDAESATVVDPWGGLADLRRGVLRCVGDPAARLAREPAIALTAARLVARHGYRIDPALVHALPLAARGLPGLPSAEVRRALWDLLGTGSPGAGITLLRQAGLEAQLVPDAQADAAAVIDALPPDADAWLRLAAWLRGTRFGDILARWRFEPGGAGTVRRVLERHPIDESVRPTVDRSVLRFVHRVDARDRAWLLTLRRGEIAAARARGAHAVAERGEASLAALAAAIERVTEIESRQERVGALALGGRDVMEALGCGPGRTVGRALAHLTRIVAADPTRNDREQLLAELAAWRASTPD